MEQPTGEDIVKVLCIAFILGAVAPAFTGSHRAHALQARPVVAPGDTVRIGYGGGRVIEGIVRQVRGDELRVADAMSERTIHLDATSRVAVRRGSRPWGPIKGGAIGLGAAVAAGLIWESTDSFEKQGCEPDPFFGIGTHHDCDRPRRNMDQWWLITGAAVGVAVGRLIRVSRWVEAAAPGVSPELGYSTEGAIELGLRVRMGGKGGSS